MKLPKAIRTRKEANQAADHKWQQTLNGHITHEPAAKRIVPYTDLLFQDATIQWLIETIVMLMTSSRLFN